MSRSAGRPLNFLATTLAVGVVSVFPFYVVEMFSGRIIESRTESWLAIGYVCVFPSLIAYLCYNRGVELIGSAAAGLYLNIMIVIGAMLAGLMLGKTIRPFHFAGAALVGTCIACAAFRVRSASRHP